MFEINLLPPDLLPGHQVFNLISRIKKFTIILSFISIIICVAGVALILFLTNQIASSVTRQNGLKTNIKSLETTEQQLFLVKDRIQNIKTIYESKDLYQEFGVINTSLSNLSPDLSIQLINVDSTKVTFSVLSTTSTGMAAFLNKIALDGTFTNIDLKDFTFIPTTGYTITLELASI